MTIITVKYQYRENPVVYTTNRYKIENNFISFYALNKDAAIAINLEGLEELEILNVED